MEPQYRPYQTMPLLRENNLGALKWCEPCIRWGNHSTNECYSRQRYMQEIGATMLAENNTSNAQPQLGNSERGRPVLGTQPTPLGTTPFPYIGEIEEKRPSMESMPFRSYYEEDSSSLQLVVSQLSDLDTSVVQLPAQALYILANGGFRSQSSYPQRSTSPGHEALAGPCYECNGPH